MTPEVSRAAAYVKESMQLVPGATLDELTAAAERARTVEDLPTWARNVLALQDLTEGQYDELAAVDEDPDASPDASIASRLVSDVDGADVEDSGGDVEGVDPDTRNRALKLAELRSRDLLEEIDLDVVEEVRTRGLDDETRAVGNQLKHYWTRGEGLAKWATKPHPWTALFRHLRKHVGSARAKRIASQWFKEVFGIWPGERKGQNPVGPG